MIQITPQTRILVAIEPVDFRKGIDGLAGLPKQHRKIAFKKSASALRVGAAFRQRS